MNGKKSSDSSSILSSIKRLSGSVAGGTLEIARNTATMAAMFGDSKLGTTLLKTLEPDRLEAMAEAGRFLQDARNTAGMSLQDLSDSLGLSNNKELSDIESGEKIMPLELMFRSASLLARHDPIPFLIKFMRTYNPALGKTLEQWGVLALPKQYERERRFLNLYRQHDELRKLSDDEYARFIEYMESSSTLVLDVMQKEKAANKTGKKADLADTEDQAAATKTPPKKRKPRAKVRPKKKA
jgi:transcriptional regulator with XRE-family HTH domain